MVLGIRCLAESASAGAIYAAFIGQSSMNIRFLDGIYFTFSYIELDRVSTTEYNVSTNPGYELTPTRAL
jgi:hypothetical protein